MLTAAITYSCVGAIYTAGNQFVNLYVLVFPVIMFQSCQHIFMETLDNISYCVYVDLFPIERSVNRSRGVTFIILGFLLFRGYF